MSACFDVRAAGEGVPSMQERGGRRQALAGIVARGPLVAFVISGPRRLQPGNREAAAQARDDRRYQDKF
jgi:hypothetical protein